MEPTSTRERPRARLARGEAVVAGVLSGTSADGIDVALVRFPRLEPGEPVGAPALLAFETRPFPGPLGARVRDLLAAGGEGLGARALALLDRDLGRAFGAAARASAEAAGLPLDLVGSHGQTVWHHDGVDPEGRATLQLGDGDFVAAEAGAAVVSDFRAADVAAGGEGAPLTALVDDLLYAAAPRPAAILNLGGIANLTLLGARGEPPRAFDVGPANALLDGLARRLLGEAYDRDGRVAAGGEPDAALVAAILAHPFFARRPPKSTGRDTFGEAWIDGLLAGAPDRRPADLLLNAAVAIATSVHAALRLWGPPELACLVPTGGGVHHRPLRQALAAVPAPLLGADAVGPPADAREAVAFAVLAARALRGEPSTHPGATGARPGRVLGKLSAPPG